MRTHTPGPWEAWPAPGTDARTDVVSPEHGHIATAETAEDALVLAAALDLLAALEADDLVQREGYTRQVAQQLGDDAAAAFFRGGPNGLNEWLKARRRTAIAKARGES